MNISSVVSKVVDHMQQASSQAVAGQPETPDAAVASPGLMLDPPGGEPLDAVEWVAGSNASGTDGVSPGDVSPEGPATTAEDAPLAGMIGRLFGFGGGGSGGGIFGGLFDSIRAVFDKLQSGPPESGTPGNQPQP